MAYQKYDTLLAFKAIALMPSLNCTEKQVAAFFIDSYNKKTGRCDPSEATASIILNKSLRTIVRAVNGVVKAKAFKKERHGGNNHCNSYTPNWEYFRKLEAAYQSRRHKHAERFKTQNLSHLDGQACHSSDDNVGTQTCSKNTIPLTSGSLPSQDTTSVVNRRHEVRRRNPADRAKEPVSKNVHGAQSVRAAEAAAVRRWNDDVRRHFSSIDAYAGAIDLIDQALQDAATTAEMQHHGAGLPLIVRELKRLSRFSPPSVGGPRQEDV